MPQAAELMRASSRGPSSALSGASRVLSSPSSVESVEAFNGEPVARHIKRSAKLTSRRILFMLTVESNERNWLFKTHHNLYKPACWAHVLGVYEKGESRWGEGKIVLSWPF